MNERATTAMLTFNWMTMYLLSNASLATSVQALSMLKPTSGLIPQQILYDSLYWRLAESFDALASKVIHTITVKVLR
ncbi:hypothetical protein BDC45DRAFT_567301 [Circinella umbellata]|nr:hypothetical protein BDC45DRAFT_567301 [Circinella umbellata]